MRKCERCNATMAAGRPRVRRGRELWCQTCAKDVEAPSGRYRPGTDIVATSSHDPYDYSQCSSRKDDPTFCLWHQSDHLTRQGEPNPVVNGHAKPFDATVDVPRCDLCNGFHDTLRHYDAEHDNGHKEAHREGEQWPGIGDALKHLRDTHGIENPLDHALRDDARNRPEEVQRSTRKGDGMDPMIDYMNEAGRRVHEHEHGGDPRRFPAPDGHVHNGIDAHPIEQTDEWRRRTDQHAQWRRSMTPDSGGAHAPRFDYPRPLHPIDHRDLAGHPNRDADPALAGNMSECPHTYDTSERDESLAHSKAMDDERERTGEYVRPHPDALCPDCGAYKWLHTPKEYVQTYTDRMENLPKRTAPFEPLRQSLNNVNRGMVPFHDWTGGHPKDGGSYDPSEGGSIAGDDRLADFLIDFHSDPAKHMEQDHGFHPEMVAGLSPERVVSLHESEHREHNRNPERVREKERRGIGIEHEHSRFTPSTSAFKPKPRPLQIPEHPFQPHPEDARECAVCTLPEVNRHHVDVPNYQPPLVPRRLSHRRTAVWSEARHPQPIIHVMGQRPPRPLMAGDKVMHPESGFTDTVVGHSAGLLMMERSGIMHRAPIEGDHSKSIIGESIEDHDEARRKLDEVGTPEERDFLKGNTQGPTKWSSKTASAKLPGGYLDEESHDNDHWAKPDGEAPYDPTLAHHGLEPKQEGHGPWHITRHPETRAYQLVDNQNRLVHSYSTPGHPSYERYDQNAEHRVVNDWTAANQDHGHMPKWHDSDGNEVPETGLNFRNHMGRGLHLPGTERARRQGEPLEDAQHVDTQHVQFHAPAPPFPHSTEDPRDEMYRNRARHQPAPRVLPPKIVTDTSSREHGTTYRRATPEEYDRPGAFHDPSPSDEYHGPYKVIQHAQTGKFHVADNQGRLTDFGGRHGMDDQATAEERRDYAEGRQRSKQQGRQLAEHIFNSTMDVLDPGGTPEGRRTDRHTDALNNLAHRYEGGTHHPLTPGRFGADDYEHDGDGEGEPYYEVSHPSGYKARDYGGNNIHIYHAATGETAHDLVGIHGGVEGDFFTKGQKPAGFGHEDLHRELHSWVTEHGGDAEHHDPRIRPWQRRRGYTASRVVAVEDGPDFEYEQALHELVEHLRKENPYIPFDVLADTIDKHVPKHAPGTFEREMEDRTKESSKDKRFDGVSLKQDDDGKWYVQTHRARSDSYDSPEKIPQKDVDFIESTGSFKDTGEAAAAWQKAKASGATTEQFIAAVHGDGSCAHGPWDSSGTCLSCGYNAGDYLTHDEWLDNQMPHLHDDAERLLKENARGEGPFDRNDPRLTREDMGDYPKPIGNWSTFGDGPDHEFYRPQRGETGDQYRQRIHTHWSEENTDTTLRKKYDLPPNPEAATLGGEFVKRKPQRTCASCKVAEGTIPMTGAKGYKAGDHICESCYNQGGWPDMKANNPNGGIGYENGKPVPITWKQWPLDRVKRSLNSLTIDGFLRGATSA